MNLHQLSIGPLLRLDAQPPRLLCAGEPVPLRPRALDVLRVLAEAGGAVVGKDELLARVWPGQVVEENNLQVHVSAIRRMLERHAAGTVELVTLPGRGYKLVARPAEGAAGGTTPLLAVLPFDTFGDPQAALLARGMAEELSLGISRIRWLSVAGSPAPAADEPADLRALARALGLDYLVQGSLRRDGQRLRVTARLLEAGRFTQLWGERYERDLQDLFTLQDEIAGAVVSAVEPGIARAELARIARKPPASLQAWERTLEAGALLRTLMPAEAVRALPLLDAALQDDPHHAPALALKAWCHHVIYSRDGLAPAQRAASVTAARAALADGPDDPAVLATAGLVLWFDAHEGAAAFGLFDRALALSPSSFLALAGSAVALAWSGQPALAAARAQQALRLNPLHPLRYLAWQGLSGARLQQGDAAGAAEAAARAVEANPGFSIPLAYLCAAQQHAGQPAAARESAARLLAAQPGFRVAAFRATVGVDDAVFGLFAQAWREAGLPD